MKQILLLTFFIPFFGFSQEIKGKIIDNSSSSGIPGARILSSEGTRAVSNVDGTFNINYKNLPFTIIVTATSFLSDTLEITSDKFVNVKLEPEVIEMESLVVTASRRGQNIEEVPISMEILKPVLIDNKGITDLEQAVDQSPGVYAMDGQVSIRGGSGYSYGAGSRVLLLWNDMPMISGDAGDAKWNTVPMELSSQIEVIKGASSVLYGSGALNGIIAVTEREPTRKPELKIKLQSGVYDDARRASLNWRSKNPTFQLAEVTYGRMHRKIGYNISFTGFDNKGFRDGESERRGRISGSVFFNSQKVKGLKAGIGYSVHYQKLGSFIVWQNDTLAYTPSGGSDINVPGSTLSITKGLRMNIDPYVKYIDKKGNKHNLRTRLYRVDNTSYTNSGQNSVALNYYADYLFTKKWNDSWFLNTGVTSNISVVNSALYGDHHSNNYSAYAQLEKKYKKLDLTAGVRLEYFEQDNRRGDSKFNLGNGKSLPFFPIFRTAAHYELFKYTHLRASVGQGVRYPAIAERYTQTSVGSLNVFPNPNLQPETGWAIEFGIKQGVKMGKSFKGFLDVSAFVNEYNNMMEFTFGLYNPSNITISLNPDSPGYINKWLGFRADNAERARISGIETSFSSEGKIGNVEIRSLIGYTYMNPVSLNNDPIYRATFSDTSGNLLKYRFNHLAKADVEVVFKGINIGASVRYNSFMKNIDRVFEDEVVTGTGIYILPGLKRYRQENNHGNVVFDARIGYDFNKNYRVGFIINNLLNTEYMGRPGDIQAPRSFMFQVQAKIS